MRWACVAVAAGSPAALAQSDIDPVLKYAWQENVGWTNWRDAAAGAQGVFVGSGQFLSGFVWGENIGWINCGDGTPGGGSFYTQAPVAGVLDFGVNIAGDGAMSGYAWAENVGWINFGVFATLPAAQRARYDFTARRFRGYAWGENIGWLNLDDAAHYVAQRCLADLNGDGLVDFSDYLEFLNLYDAGDPAVDFNGDGLVDFSDYLEFLNYYDAGC
ncbi:MAG: EF-hand domain-containing protein [Phycisphaerales bacterium]|nr:EF-hand domain-containing protein [Phycisphaerales bacterium]